MNDKLRDLPDNDKVLEIENLIGEIVYQITINPEVHKAIGKHDKRRKAQGYSI